MGEILWAWNLSTVYPCVYREHYIINCISKSKRGLSLCIQGTSSVKYKFSYNIRFIPVYTGNIWIISRNKTPLSVYPCVYREHAPIFVFELFAIGLSLCIQGTFVKQRKYWENKRFIPVYTGNMFKLTLNLRINAVYPCVYREHVIVPVVYSELAGLSLCIQGTWSLA